MEHLRLAGCIVLVVEDEPLVALDLAGVLEAVGAHVVTARRADEAILSADRFQVCAAVLDINLGDHDCGTVCEHLWKRRIPFLFHTGYSAPLEGWADVAVIRKPAEPQEIVKAVEQLCGQHRQAA